jgi:MacB-like protein
VTAPSRLLPADIARVGAVGLRTRPLRAALSALGIAIGIAAMVCVVGVASSSRESLNRQLAALGTNLLRVSPGQTILGGQSHLPSGAVAMIGRIPPVTSVTATAALPNMHVYRSDLIPSIETGNLSVLAARTDLLGTVGAHLASGAWLNQATARYPAVVLGAMAARRLGVIAATPQVQVWLGGRWFTVTGVLRAVPLGPELDYAALVGWPAAASHLRFDGHPTTVYTRTRDDAVTAVQAILAATANPQNPNEVSPVPEKACPAWPTVGNRSFSISIARGKKRCTTGRACGRRTCCGSAPGPPGAGPARSRRPPPRGRAGDGRPGTSARHHSCRPRAAAAPRCRPGRSRRDARPPARQCPACAGRARRHRPDRRTPEPARA